MAITNADRDKRTYDDYYAQRDENKRLIDSKTLKEGTDEYNRAKAAAFLGVDGMVTVKDGIWKPVTASVKYDTSTGKIKVTAPKAVMGSDWFKKQYVENDVFNQIANMFKANPTGNTTVKIQDKSGNVVEKKITDWLDEESDALSVYANNYMKQVVPLRNQVYEMTNGGIKMSDNEIMIAQSALSRDKYRYDENSVVYLPSSILRLGHGAFEKMGSWNEETQTVNAKDFYDWYDLDDDKGKDYMEMEKVLNWEMARLSGADEYGEGDSEQLARVLSFYKTLKNDDPEANFIQGAGLFLQSFEQGFKKVLVDGSINLYSFFEDALTAVSTATSLNTDSGKVLAGLTLGTSAVLGAGTSLSVGLMESSKITATNFGELIAGIDNAPLEQNAVESFIAIGDITAGLMSGKGQETLQHWSQQTNTPLNSQALAIVDRIYDEKLTSLAEISGAANAGRVIGSFAGEVVKQIALTNVIGKAVGAFSKAAVIDTGKIAYSAFNFGNNIQGLTEALALGVEKYVKTASLAEGTYAFAKATEVTAAVLGAGSNLLAQGLVDTVLNDEQVIKDMLTQPNDEHRVMAYNAVANNVLINAFGEVSGFGFELGGRATKGAVGWWTENTLAGASAESAARRGINYLAAKKHMTLGRFADWMAEGQSKGAKFFNKIFKASDEASKWYNDLHWREAEASLNIAYASKGIDTSTRAGKVAANEATQKAVLERMELEVSLNRVTRGIMREWQSLVKNPAIAKEYAEFGDAMSRLVKAEGGNSVKLGKGTFMSQETADYIALTSILERLSNKEVLTKAEEAYQKALQDRVSNYISTHSVEVKMAADEVLASFRKYEKAYMDFAMKTGDDGGLGLYDEKEVLGWRDTGYWGENGDQYIPLVRIEGEEGTLGAAKRSTDSWSQGGNYKAKLSVDEYELKPGDADAHYLDPSLSLYAQQVTAAKVLAARDWGDVLMKTDALAKEIDTEGNAITHAEIKSARSQVRQIISKTFDDLSKTEDILNYGFNTAYKRGTNAAMTRARNSMLRLIGLSSKADYHRAAYGLDAEDIINLGKRGYKIPKFDKMRNKYQLQEFYDSLSKADQRAIDNALGTEPLTVKNYNNALDNTNLRLKLQRNYVNYNIVGKDNSKAYNKYIELKRRNALRVEQRLKYDKAYADYKDAVQQNVTRVEGKDDFTKMIGGFFEDAYAKAAGKLADNKFFNQLIDRYAEEGIPADVARRYLIVQEMKNYFETGTRKKAYQEMLQKNLDNIDVSGNLTSQAKLKAKQAINEGLEGKVETEWANSVKMLKDAGGEELLDTESIYEYIYKQMSDFVDTTIKNPNVIQVLDRNGQFHLYEVDPTTANLYTTRPNLSSYRQNGITKFFNKTNRLARLNNVGWNLKSFMNQWVRDPLNAFVMGGMMETLGKNAEAMGELLGPQVIQLMKESLGEAGWKSFTEQAAEQLGREATEEELATAAKEALTGNELKEMANEAVGDLGVETEYYRNLSTGYKEAEWGEYQEQPGLAGKALNFAEEHSLGNFRETYLRKGVYARSFNDAIAAGRTIREARIIAEYTMLNATTNFSRAFAWGNNWTTSVSFLGAAINGKASFWRLFEIDPIGISSRFFNGLVLPIVYLTGQSLQTETDRAIYRSIPEYEKDDKIVFVVNGTKMSIPIPQELSSFVAPFRHLVEKAYDGNRHAWDELLWNDILGMSAIDLSGFADLDANILTGDLSLADRISSEALTLIAQLSPTAFLTAFKLITGIDPYTGNKIDTQKVYLDEDGNMQVYGYNESEFTKWLSSTLKGMGIDLSASSAHAMIQTLFGNGGAIALDWIGDMFSDKSNEEKLNITLESTVGELAAPFISNSSNDAAQYAWSEMVREMQAKKESILNSKEYQTIAEGLANLDSTKSDYEEKRKTLLRQYNDLVQDYQNEVYNAVKRIQSVYGSDYDKKRFSATIGLMTFKRNFGTSINEVEKEANKTLSYEASSRAKQTMASYGFDSPTDLSIFGYMRTDEYGNVEMKMNSPVAIMNLPSEVWGTTDQDIANIGAILSANEIDREAMFGDEYKKAKAAGKKALKQYKANWNANVIIKLYPYIKEHGIDNVTGNSRTVTELQRYIFVDNPYKAKESIIKLFGGK